MKLASIFESSDCVLRSGISRSQRGATLMVSLVILSVMTIVGVSTMQSATLQERMASNARQKLVARSAAESALRVAEQFLTANISDFESISQSFRGGGALGFLGDALYSEFDDGDVDISTVNAASRIEDISDDDDWINDLTASYEVPELSKEWARSPRFFIEYMGQAKGASGSQIQNIDEDAKDSREPHIFRVTAIGWGQDVNIYSVLQSTFITGSQDFTY